MGFIIKSIHIENFRGIKNIDISFNQMNVFIGDNGANKTTILEAINYAFSPAFLSGRIKSTDFYEGTNDLIKIRVEFNNNFRVKLPDGYTHQEIGCNKISLTIKKREKKAPGKILSDLATIEHVVLPIENPQIGADGTQYWELKRKGGTIFRFDARLLSFNVFESEEIPRVFYFNKERDKQLAKGFNTTFTSILNDFNWRFLKQVSNDTKIFNKISETEKEILGLTKIDELDYIKIFNDKIREFQLDNIDFSFIEKSSPFNQAYFSKNFEKINLPIKYLGSGIEMIYSLLFLDTMASLSKENLIILIDEPEIHLHPKLQEQITNYLFKLSQNEKYQIFITTHSPIFFKTLVNKNNVKSIIAKKENAMYSVAEYDKKQSIFPWGPTWGEINYFAYDYPTLEFHNELYGYLQEETEKYNYDEFDNYLNNIFSIEKNKKWIPEKNGKTQQEKSVTLMSFIRHKIHHPENQSMKDKDYTPDELRTSIKQMLQIINELKKQDELNNLKNDCPSI